jgi:hypothetical protein
VERAGGKKELSNKRMHRIANRNRLPVMQTVSPALRAGLTPELIGPAGPLARVVFRMTMRNCDALTRASRTSRSNGNGLHSQTFRSSTPAIPLNSAFGERLARGFNASTTEVSTDSR